MKQQEIKRQSSTLIPVYIILIFIEKNSVSRSACRERINERINGSYYSLSTS